jgi:uncharacterized membrane protein
MEEAIIVLIIFGSAAYVVKILAEARTRNRLIEKGLVDEKVKFLFTGNQELQTLSSLKWGMVLVGIGAAALLSQLFPYYFEVEAAIGLAFILAGVAFLVYYPLASSRLKKLEKKDNAPHPPEA